MAAHALEKLGKYQIRGTLGRGAMGIVYDGFDPVIERRVAIKTIAKESIDPREAAELLTRFRREAQAAGRLNHPAIVSIHDYGEEDGLAFIAMEFIKGNELRTYFDSRQRFALADIVRIMCDILDALDHAHRNGVVHRDIKPANIMITDEGRVKIADFGVARIESSTMTQVGVRVGTPAYMSPEQHLGSTVTGRSDLFSVGVILYEFLTGQRPFTGEGYALIRQILMQDAIPPSQINVDIPPALDAVTLKALAKHPEDRFETAREFAAAFREAASGESIGVGVDLLSSDGVLEGNRSSAMPPPASGRGTSGANAISSNSNPSDISLEAELEYWKEIKDSTETTDFATFLEVFPESRFAPLARRRMNRLETEAKSGQDADEQVQREEEKTLLLVAADSRSIAEASARQESAEHARLEAAAQEGAQARTQRDVDRRLPRIDAAEPTLVRPATEANDSMPSIDVSPRAIDPTSLPGVGLARPTGLSGSAYRRRRRTAPAHTEALGFAGSRRSSRASRNPAWRPIALAAVLVGSGIWLATRPELAPLVATLRTQAQTIVTQFEQQWHEREAQPATQKGSSDAASLAEEQRSNEAALSAERDRQMALARQKEEAARAAAAQNYQRAMALLNQGRGSEAVRLLRQLANAGHGAAAKTLGDLYSRGEEVLLDWEEAARFYAIAERNGVKVERATLRR